MTKNHPTQGEILDQRGALIAAGVIDTKGTNATPRIRHCSACGLGVWAAWRDGLFETVLADPIALTPLGELQAVTAGRRTLTHWRDGLDLRRPESITRWPANDSAAYPIRPEHRCGSPPIDHYPNKRATKDNANDIPF